MYKPCPKVCYPSNRIWRGWCVFNRTHIVFQFHGLIFYKNASGTSNDCLFQKPYDRELVTKLFWIFTLNFHNYSFLLIMIRDVFKQNESELKSKNKACNEFVIPFPSIETHFASLHHISLYFNSYISGTVRSIFDGFSTKFQLKKEAYNDFVFSFKSTDSFCLVASHPFLYPEYTRTVHL